MKQISIEKEARKGNVGTKRKEKEQKGKKNFHGEKKRKKEKKKIKRRSRPRKKNRKAETLRSGKRVEITVVILLEANLPTKSLWARSTKNPDKSTGPLARPFLRSLICSLAHFTRSLACGTVNDWMAILSVFVFHFEPWCKWVYQIMQALLLLVGRIKE